MWRKALIDPISVTVGVLVGNALTLAMLMILRDQLPLLAGILRRLAN
jgi:hypothetical protein